jgi:hypothetical protein
MPRKPEPFRRSRKEPLKARRRPPTASLIVNSRLPADLLSPNNLNKGTPQVRTLVEANDPLASHDRTAISELCAIFLVTVLRAPRSYFAPESGCHMPLSHFIARALRHTRYDDFVVHGALLLLHRARMVSSMVISGPGPFLAALIVSSKWFFD